MKNKTRVKQLTVSAVMIALSTVLSLVTIFKMPLGGSVTIFNMLPVCMISIMYGCGWGALCAAVYSAMQLVLGVGDISGSGLSPVAFAGSIVLDYLLAFIVLGLAGAFRKKGVWGCVAGITLAVCLRMVCHVLSGVLIFAIWAPDGWQPLPYSLAYNGLYMAPELVLTVLGAVFLLKEPHAARLFRLESPAE